MELIFMFIISHLNEKIHPKVKSLVRGNSPFPGGKVPALWRTQAAGEICDWWYKSTCAHEGFVSVSEALLCEFSPTLLPLHDTPPPNPGQDCGSACQRRRKNKGLASQHWLAWTS